MPPVPDWSVTTASPAVVLAVEVRRLLQALELASQRRDRRLDLGGHLRVELEQADRVLVLPAQALVHLEPLRDAGVLGGDLLRALLVVPEAGLAHRLLELG